ncbi:SH3 domain-containing protein [Methylobacterium frigidaeris]|uniref:SH3 domain-containing protein n=1 Tax=Methylobacterium frigidaeris TaxID=2038277 RepID=UPI001EDDED91|nr:SH3 domain-containing protein [Methylobacterium frigidaeris]
MLNQNRHLLVPFADLPDLGDIDDELLERIEVYQRRVVTDATLADGRVDPGGRTLAKLNENARDFLQLIPLFPLHARPTQSYKTGGRQFRYRRDGGARLHAACDLKAPPGTPVRSMDEGTVVQPPRTFYDNTIALEVNHGNYIARYGEMSHTVPGLNRAGVAIRKGQTIGFVGRLSSGNSMLHLELYSGSAVGPLTVRRRPFNRRSDLLDPTDFLDLASMEVDDTPEFPFPDAAFGLVSPRITGRLNLRDGPSTSAAVRRTLRVGDRFKILGRVEGGDYPASGRTRKDWLKVELNGVQGFVGAFYVDPEPQVGRVSDRVTTRLRLRAQPQEASGVLASLTRGTRLAILRKVDGDDYEVGGASRRDWFEVDHDGAHGYVAAFFVDLVEEDSGPAGALNAILFTFEPGGASDRTARQDGLRGGVAASETMAQTDRARVMRFKARYMVAAAENDLPPALLAAIASRESRGGSALDEDGFGDRGHGYGLMQIDDRSYRADNSEGPFGQAHISQASDILKAKLERVQSDFGALTDSAQLQTAVSRYNGGRGQAAPNSDVGTTGGDYCNDVWARARYYAQVEAWGP